MKKILITGANSYIGDSIRDHLRMQSGCYDAETLDMIDGSWKEKSFQGYEAVIHVAGIAHQKESEDNRELYYQVNCDLAIETAKKAKEEGVELFVFLSSMSIYGMETGVINEDTIPHPNTHYGKSKLQAEQGLKALEDEIFLLAIIRPPMIYGEGCRGNYNALVKFANTLPIFPDFKNKRSMLHIGRLCEFVQTVIDGKIQGILFPQDEEYVCTSEMVREIAEKAGRKICLVKWLNPFVYIMMKFPGKVGSLTRKAFGNLVYEIEGIF